MTFLNDGFSSADTYLITENMGTDFKGDLLTTGFIPKGDKSCWIPTQKLQWLIVLLNSNEYFVKTPMNRVQRTLDTLKYLWSLPWLPVWKVTSFGGQIIPINTV